VAVAEWVLTEREDEDKYYFQGRQREFAFLSQDGFSSLHSCFGSM
jgi:hypothetical protein